MTLSNKKIKRIAVRTPPGCMKTRSKKNFFLDESKGSYHLVKNEWFYNVDFHSACSQPGYKSAE